MQANKFNPLNSVMVTSLIQMHPSSHNIKLCNVQIKATFPKIIIKVIKIKLLRPTTNFELQEQKQ